MSRPALGSIVLHYSVGTEGCFLRGKAGRAWMWPLTTEVMKEQKYSHTPITFLHGVDTRAWMWPLTTEVMKEQRYSHTPVTFLHGVDTRAWMWPLTTKVMKQQRYSYTPVTFLHGVDTDNFYNHRACTSVLRLYKTHTSPIHLLCTLCTSRIYVNATVCFVCDNRKQFWSNLLDKFKSGCKIYTKLRSYMFLKLVHHANKLITDIKYDLIER